GGDRDEPRRRARDLRARGDALAHEGPAAHRGAAGPPARPDPPGLRALMATAPAEVAAKARELLGAHRRDSHTHQGDATIPVGADSAGECLQRLRDDAGLAFNLLIDITAVDYLGRAPRFELVYHLASLDLAPPAGEPAKLRHRLRVKVGVAE